MTQPVEAGYSASVALRLHVGGEVLRLAQVGPERILLKQPRSVPSGAAELEIVIDGAATRQAIVVDAADGDGEIRYRISG